jgi:hypothetical protein
METVVSVGKFVMSHVLLLHVDADRRQKIMRIDGK